MIMTVEQVTRRLSKYDPKATCASLEEKHGDISLHVVPTVVFTCPDITEWKAEAIAIMEAIADDTLGGAAASLPEKCAIALQEMLGPRAVKWLVRYLQQDTR